VEEVGADAFASGAWVVGAVEGDEDEVVDFDSSGEVGGVFSYSVTICFHLGSKSCANTQTFSSFPTKRHRYCVRICLVWSA